MSNISSGSNEGLFPGLHNYKIPFITENPDPEPISIVMANGIVRLIDTPDDSVSTNDDSSSKSAPPLTNQWPMASNGVLIKCEPRTPPTIRNFVNPIMSVDPSGGGKRKSSTEIGATTSSSLDRLPVDLTKLFLPLFCGLCGIHSNSPISAKAHYDSIGHDKRIDAFLLKREQEMGEPAPKKAKAKNESGTALHCTVCDIALTSAAMADQHYMGRKHKSAARAQANATGSQTVLSAPLAVRSASTSAGVSSATPLNASLAPIVAPNPDVFCTVCNICVSSKNEMQAHLEGSRHAKRLRAAGVAPYTADPDKDTIMRCVRDSIIQLLPSIVQMQRDTSINRTPSGQFYCKTCDVTVDTEGTFRQHLDSKRHRRQNK